MVPCICLQPQLGPNSVHDYLQHVVKSGKFHLLNAAFHVGQSVLACKRRAPSNWITLCFGNETQQNRALVTAECELQLVRPHHDTLRVSLCNYCWPLKEYVFLEEDTLPLLFSFDIFPPCLFRNQGLLSRIDQHCLFYSDPAHHYLRKWREPKPSLQRGPPQSQILSPSKGASHPDGKPWVSATTPDQSPYAPAAEYTPHSLWGRRGWRKPQRQTGRATWGAHRRRGMLKKEKKRNADGDSFPRHHTLRTWPPRQSPPINSHLYSFN